jgi:hypothetical protein
VITFTFVVDNFNRKVTQGENQKGHKVLGFVVFVVDFFNGPVPTVQQRDSNHF